MDDAITPAKLQKAVGISRSYASMLLNGRRRPPIRLALTIFDQTGHKLGDVVGASEQEIASMRSILARSDVQPSSPSEVPSGRTVGSGAPIVPCDQSAELKRSARG